MSEIESAEADPPDTRLFGKYEMGKLLGHGAFAKVYHARDMKTGQSVAVKVISKKRVSSATLTSNIKREIAIMRRLRHPNIVRLYEVLATKTKIYFVMEFVKGGELFARVSKGKLSEDLSHRYFRQLISAVGYCHSRGVYHRDLKPENLLVDENGDLKVSDFGLSALTGQIRPDGLLHTLCGTPAYVAPEILNKKGYDGAKVDVWSCGVVLFVLASGFLPFNDPNLIVMYKKIYKGEYRCPRGMSSDLKLFLTRVLETRPEKRITVDQITRDPWFKKGGGREISFYGEDFSDDFKLGEADEDSLSSLNAFDIISFSPGLDLSGLFRDSQENGERVLVGESPGKVMEVVEGAAKGEENVRLTTRKDRGVCLEGQSCNSAVELGAYRLTNNFTVVEVKSRGVTCRLYDELWKKKIRPELLG